MYPFRKDLPIDLIVCTCSGRLHTGWYCCSLFSSSCYKEKYFQNRPANIDIAKNMNTNETLNTANYNSLRGKKIITFFVSSRFTVSLLLFVNHPSNVTVHIPKRNPLT